MQEAQTGPFAKIGELLRKHPENSLDILDDDKDHVIYQKKVLAQVRLNKDIFTTFFPSIFYRIHILVPIVKPVHDPGRYEI